VVPHGIGIGIGKMLLLVVLVLVFGAVVLLFEVSCVVFGLPNSPDLNPPEEDFEELELLVLPELLEELELLELELLGIDLGVLKLPDLILPDEDLELLLNPLDLKLLLARGFA
jgi:hypothetical protein